MDIFEQQRRSLEDTSKRLIGQINTADFVTRSRTFLNFNQLKTLPPNRVPPIEKPVYKQPSYKDALEPEEIRKYLQKNFLGSIEILSPMPKESGYEYPILRHVTKEGSLEEIKLSVSGATTAMALSEFATIHNGSDDQNDFLKILHWGSMQQKYWNWFLTQI